MPLNPPITDWRGRRAWIVGGSTGIGLAIAQALHGAGASVCVSARSAEPLAEFIRTHAGSRAVPLDVTSQLQMQDAWAEVSAHGVPDLIAYCAGHYRPVTAAGFDLREALRHNEVNYVGALHLLDAVLPAMLRGRRGHLSLMASVAGYRGLPRSLAYGPTKAALINLAQSLHLELQPHGVGVSVVNPGFVDTPLTAQNQFHMPALIAPDEAARQTLRGWARGEFEIHYPKRFTRVMKMMSLLPFGAYAALVRRVTA